MGKAKKIFSLQNKVSAVCMILALLWLTVSAPVVFAAQQKLSKCCSTECSSGLPVNEEESTNPFGSNTEEKAPSGTSFSEEYLHDSHLHQYFGNEILKHFGCGDATTYIAFHGELLVPPPNAV
jgi:hypothetical protein